MPSNPRGPYLTICSTSTSVKAESPRPPETRRRGPSTSPFCVITLLVSCLAVGAGASESIAPYAGRAVILNYHHISEDGKEGPATISADRFEEHLRFLKGQKFTVVSTKRLCRFLSGTDTLPPKAVCITFDDGYRSYAQVAVPILKRYGYPSTCFVVVADASRAPTVGKLPHMSWDEMESLPKAGPVSFGSHTYDTHGLLPGSNPSKPMTALASRLASETASAYSRRVRADLRRSRHELRARLGAPVDTLAYPYGVWSSELVSAASAEGFRFMFTTDSGAVTATTDRTCIPRLNAGSSWVTVGYLAGRVRSLVK